LLFPNSYTILFWEFYILPFSVYAQTNTILYPYIFCTCPNQHNSISLHSLYMPKSTQFYILTFSVHTQTNTILYPYILCTCPNQHNSISLHSLYMPKPTQFYILTFSVHAQTNVIHLTLISWVGPTYRNTKIKLYAVNASTVMCISTLKFVESHLSFKV
jgi:hypothetical protein